MSDLATATREELLERSKKCHVENAHKLSNSQLQKEIYTNEAVLKKSREERKIYEDMDQKEFEDLLIKHEIEYSEDDLEKRDFAIIKLRSAINMKEMQEKFDSALDYEADEEVSEDMPLSDAKYHYEKLKSLDVPKDVKSDSYRQHQNLITGYANIIRSKFGLEPKEVNYTDNDLESLLLLDDMEVGENSREFLEGIKNPARKADYEMRMKELSNLYFLEKRQEKEEKEKIYKLTIEGQKLSKVPKKLINTHAGIEVNPSYTEWRENLLLFRSRLQNTQKGYLQSGKQVPEEVEKIINDTSSLYQKHK